MPALTPLNGLFLGTILEALFYGIYIVLFGVFISLQRRKGDLFSGPLTPVTSLLFFLCTVFFCLDVPQQYFTLMENQAQPYVAWGINQANSTLYSVIDFLAQTILIYRCWIVWRKRWIVIAFPIVMALAALAGEFALVGLLNSIGPDGSIRQIPTLVPTGKGAFSVSVAVNASVTILIIIRIWIVSREIERNIPNSTRTFRVIISMLAESGLFLFVVQLVYVITFSERTPGFQLVSSPTTMIYGITPTVLAIRVKIGVPYEDDHESTSLNFASMSQTKTAKTQATTDTEPSTMYASGSLSKVSRQSEKDEDIV